jgi:hypothetical protein
VTRHALLNNTEHRDLRVTTTRSAALGDDVMAVLTFPAEFRNVQAHYPIVFTKSREGTYTPLALLGFREKQNLFLKPDGWDAPYVPLMIERAPFFIGTSSNGKMIHIDLDSPRVGHTEGEAVFLEHGGNSDFLGRVGGMLATIHDGVAATAPFMAALLEHNLLESFVLDIEFRDGSQHRLAGFETVQEDRLNALTGEALEKLHQRGHLQAIYMIIASLSNFRGLIERANKLNAAER